MNNLVVIERYSPSSLLWPNLIKKKKASHLSLEQILNKYQGFEGELTAFFSINDSEKELNEMIIDLGKYKNSKKYEVLFVISNPKLDDHFLNTHATKLGYDVGICEEESTLYSSIYNEILFGNIEELIDYQNQLNDNLLFSDYSSAEKYISFHNELSIQGKDVEDYEKMNIYQVWKCKE